MLIFGSPEATTIFSILAILAAITLTVLIAIFILPEKRRDRLNPFFKFLHDLFNFKYLVLESILRIFYVFANVFVVIMGVLSFFSFSPSYYGGLGEWTGYTGLLMIILGPIVIRIMYEFMMMAILLVKNVIQINNKLKVNVEKKEEKEEKHEPVSVAPATPAMENKFCSNCGFSLDENGNCPKCK